MKGAVRHPGHFSATPRQRRWRRGTRESAIIASRSPKASAFLGSYDYGPATVRVACNPGPPDWMGDAGFLKRIRTELRRFNTMGDTTWCKGKVTRKYKKDGLCTGGTRHLGRKPARRSNAPQWGRYCDLAPKTSRPEFFAMAHHLISGYATHRGLTQ